nr:MAG TPA: DNA POLYMERASE [Caudoviricetes sp.]
MAIFPRLENYDVVAIDTETTGLDWFRGDKPFGVAVALPNGYSEYYDIRKDLAAYQWLRDSVHKIRRPVNHNMKFDIHMLRQINVMVNTRTAECTQIRAALINEHLMSYSLDALAKKYLKAEKVDDIYEELAQLFGGPATRKAQAPNFHRAPESMMRRYAKVDAELALQLWQWQEEEIDRQDLREVWRLEMRLQPHVIESERVGIRVDEELAKKRISDLTKIVDQTRKEINRLAGFEVNPNPSGSIKKLFEPYKEGDQWYAKDGTPIDTTDAGQPSLGADALKRIKHPAAGLILKCRKMIKTRDTFISGHVLGNIVNGYVHPNINQTKGEVGGNDSGTEGTGTGRLSYTRPALQQIPSRDKEVAALVRPIFLPDEGQLWTYGDLDQHEFRIFAHYANPKSLIDAYAANPDLDMHQIVADMTGMPRSAPASGGANAKQINLAMVFNMGGGELASQMSLPYTWETAVFKDENEERRFKKAGEEALAVMETYYRAVPGVREVARRAGSLAKSRGYVKTMYGRKIRFPGGKFTYKASGLVYQGTAADFNKRNICEIAEYIESECPHNRFLLNIHDEYSMSMLDEGDITVKHLREMKRLVQDKGLRVPIRIDFGGLAPNWWEATKMDVITK